VTRTFSSSGATGSLASSPSSACTATSGACASAPVLSRSSATSSVRPCSRARRLRATAGSTADSRVPFRPTFETPLGARYRAPGGGWDAPSLDIALTTAASPDLAARVARVAGGLREMGVRAGDAVAWQSPNRPEVDVIYRACWRLGAVAVPMHHQAGAADVARMRDAVHPTLLVETLDALPAGEAVH